MKVIEEIKEVMEIGYKKSKNKNSNSEFKRIAIKFK